MPRLAHATVAVVLALGTSAFAAHPERSRLLAHQAETHLAPHHLAVQHASAHHPLPQHGAGHTSRAHVVPVAARERTHHYSATITEPRTRQVKAHGRDRHGRTLIQEVRLHEHLHRLPRIADTAVPTSVVSVVRPAHTPRPQLLPLAEAVTEPVALPKLYNERGRLIMPAALVGSHEILLHQNVMADQDGLGRIQDDADLDAMRERGILVALPAGPALAVDERLPGNRRCSRPWTAQFLTDLSRDYYRHFHAPLQLTSAVRTVAFQQRLIHHNGNAAPADGDTASPHLTGQAVDLGKRGMSLVEIAWMRGYLLPLIQSGKIDVEEEFKQSCFHISVYRTYAPPLADRYSVATRGTTGSLATVLP